MHSKLFAWALDSYFKFIINPYTFHTFSHGENMSPFCLKRPSCRALKAVNSSRSRCATLLT